MMSKFYQFSAKSLQGKTVNMERLKGKTVLVVNTASKCGLTPQYEGLEALYQRYKDKGLVILGFPCNQFGGQDPKPNADIAEFCQANYGVGFPMMGKIEVNGEGADPIYQWLKGEKPGFLGTEGIKWNFTKFLIGKDGQVIQRYAPTDKPESLKADIEAAL